MIDTRTPAIVTDRFIPELFYDHFFIRVGKIQCIHGMDGKKIALPRQSLKTIQTKPLTFYYSTPLVLYGARFSLQFAETFREEMKANRFLRQAWVRNEADDLKVFQSQLIESLQKQQKSKLPYPMFSGGLNESSWLVHFSPRHKRRLYKDVFGLSRKEMQNIQNIQSFLEQTCDFGSQNPRIIHHVDPDVFYDQPHLNHTFKKMTGVSPVEYFETNSILQDNLMSASYNEFSGH